MFATFTIPKISTRPVRGPTTKRPRAGTAQRHCKQQRLERRDHRHRPSEAWRLRDDTRRHVDSARRERRTREPQTRKANGACCEATFPDTSYHINQRLERKLTAARHHVLRRNIELLGEASQLSHPCCLVPTALDPKRWTFGLPANAEVLQSTLSVCSRSENMRVIGENLIL